MWATRRVERFFFSIYKFRISSFFIVACEQEVTGTYHARRNSYTSAFSLLLHVKCEQFFFFRERVNCSQFYFFNGSSPSSDFHPSSIFSIFRSLFLKNISPALNKGKALVPFFISHFKSAWRLTIVFRLMKCHPCQITGRNARLSCVMIRFHQPERRISFIIFIIVIFESIFVA